MPRFTVSLLLGLAACGVFDTSGPGDLGSGEMAGWAADLGQGA
jgi:hypothetical protein